MGFLELLINFLHTLIVVMRDRIPLLKMLSYPNETSLGLNKSIQNLILDSSVSLKWWPWSCSRWPGAMLRISGRRTQKQISQVTYKHGLEFSWMAKIKCINSQQWVSFDWMHETNTHQGLKMKNLECKHHRETLHYPSLDIPWSADWNTRK